MRARSATRFWPPRSTGRGLIETLADVRYDKWRELDPEDTIRFYALRLQETGFLKSNPQKIVAEASDWRFLNDLKRELKT